MNRHGPDLGRLDAYEGACRRLSRPRGHRAPVASRHKQIRIFKSRVRAELHSRCLHRSLLQPRRLPARRGTDTRSLRVHGCSAYTPSWLFFALPAFPVRVRLFGLMDYKTGRRPWDMVGWEMYTRCSSINRLTSSDLRICALVRCMAIRIRRGMLPNPRLLPVRCVIGYR